MIKLAIFDVDGTLFDNKRRTVHQSTVTAIDRLRASGIKIAIATGRSYQRILEGVLDFIPDYVVAFSGHALVDAKGDFLFKKPLLKTEVKAIDDYTKEHKIAMSYKTATVRYCNGYLPEKYKEDPKVLPYVIEEVVYDPSWPYLNDVEVYFAAGLMDEVEGAALEESLPTMHFYYMHTGWTDITHKDIDKSKTTELLLEHLNIGWENTIAFGDGLNDIQIIEKAGIGVCMGNGYQKTKEIANIVADPIDQDGIYNTLVNLKLI
ncbi:MAG: Cof-type HAD-IIB family hydrolase [Erysipelotrichaceae bacterium]|nr:Cof-type HAD-IIB family hydrolase [Erysipelotrichaceae bacterium]MDD3924328.1 Cof-type HAD-IIB family hydrolase [Erysipelotrichaceae bacterium]MDD4643149.1 Cof-type HAD-IIB family hydrolase [Erysipelotrichaceae bacterium]